MKQYSFDKEQFEGLFEARFDDLMGFVYSYVRDREVARDIVHDSFFMLWKNRQSIDISASPRSYLYTIARNYSLNYIRHQRVIIGNEEKIVYDLRHGANELAEYENTLEKLSDYMKNLPQKQLEVLTLCFVDGKSYKEIAQTLDISLNTVKTHLKRAMKYLRDMMKEDVVLFFMLNKI